MHGTWEDATGERAALRARLAALRAQGRLEPLLTAEEYTAEVVRILEGYGYAKKAP